MPGLSIYGDSLCGYQLINFLRLSTVGYLSNSWASCNVILQTETDYWRMMELEIANDE